MKVECFESLSLSKAGDSIEDGCFSDSTNETLGCFLKVGCFESLSLIELLKGLTSSTKASCVMTSSSSLS
jgi:hypothetical protein